jgi:glycerate kinase
MRRTSDPGRARHNGRVIRRVLIAPDSFKGSLSALEACRAIARGVRAACVGAEADPCPMADGGEGTAGILAGAMGAAPRVAMVPGPMGDPIEAGWFLAPDGTAILDAASAIGLPLVPAGDRDPMRATSAGVGALILDAISHGADRVLVGLGGVATVDAGVGMLGALGWRLLDAGGGAVPPVAGSLGRIARVAPPDDDQVGERSIEALCDVRTPLLGEGARAGAAAVFGPQKGATPGQVAALERGHRGFARAVRASGLAADASAPGAGAAGGLGFAIAACFAGGRLASGVERVWRAVDGPARLAGADLLITGEGRLDEQTSMGKVVGFLAERAAVAGVPIVAICGQGPGAIPAGLPLDGLSRLVDEAPDPAGAMRRAGELLEREAERVCRGVAGGG